MSLKGVIFDLDGVIVNTVPMHFRAWKKMFSQYGRKFTFRDYKLKVDGIPRIEGARAILPELSAAELDKAASRKQAYFLEFLKKGRIKVYGDTVGLIKRLKENDIRTAVISSSKNCRYILETAGISGLFEIIITGSDVRIGKPHPDVFLLAAKRLELKTKECVVVEDAVLGIIAAKRAKMKTVGVDRYRSPERLKQADLTVSSLRKVSLSKLRGLTRS